MRNLILLFLFGINVSSVVHAQVYQPEDLIIDSVECSGNELTDCEIIKKEIYLAAGDRINEEEIKNSKIRIQLLGLFNSVDLSLQKSTEKGHVVLQVKVVEGSPYFSETSVFAASTSYDSAYYDINLDFKFGHRNLFGKGKTLQLALQPDGLTARESNSKRYTGSLEYIDPHLFGQKMYFASAKVGYSFIDEAEKSLYLTTQDNNVFYGLNLGRRVFDFSHFGVGISNSHGKRLYRDLSSDFFDSEDSQSTTYTLNYGWNSEDDQYFATEGSKLDFTYYFNGNESGSVQMSYNKNWLLEPKFIVTLSGGAWYSNFIKDSYQAELGTKWAYQFRRGEKEKGITDGRFYIEQSLRQSKRNEGAYVNAGAGVLLDAASFGIVKIGAFWSAEAE